MNFDDTDGRDATALRQWANSDISAFSRRSGMRQQ
jgi:hypothetical protein